MTIHAKYKLAKQLIKENKIADADACLEACLADLGAATLRGQTFIEGTSVNLWKARIWATIERAGLLPK